MTTSDLDLSDTVTEVLAAFERYEQALVDGDVAVLTELFWDDPRCVRFGIADRQRGSAQIAAWRRSHPAVPAGRRLYDTQVLVIDERAAVVTTLFSYPDEAVEGRQSQTWVRFAAGWRVVSAHVSHVPLGAASDLLLGVVAAHRTGQPLHHELVALGARFERSSRTAPVYRLIALPGPGIPRGGVVAVPGGGVEIEIELHRLPAAAVGTLLAALPAPLAIGPIELVDGTALGILCLAAPPGARDISEHGSWPAYLASSANGQALTTRP